MPRPCRSPCISTRDGNRRNPYHYYMTPSWPDLRALDLLVRIGTRGSLGAAAREVGMAQPNASRSVRRLEQETGLVLVHRSTRGSHLTPTGVLIAEWAVGILGPARDLVANAAALRVSARARLTVGASRTVAEVALPQWLGALRREHPEAHVTLEVDNSTVICEGVLAGRQHVGFVESPGAPAALRSHVVAVDDLVVVVAPSHPWARRTKGITAEELTTMPLVVRELGSGTRTTLERALSKAGLERLQAPPALELGSNEAVRVSVASGIGPAVLSELAVRTGLAGGQLVQVPVRDLSLRRRLRAVWVGPQPLEGLAADLLRHAKTIGAGSAVAR